MAMNKGKIIFVAYENFWERIFLFCSVCCALLLVLGGLYHWGEQRQISLAWVYIVLGIECGVLGYTLYVAFKPCIKLYTGGIKIPGYPLFEWKDLKKSRFVFLSEERNSVSPDQELELIASENFSWKAPWWRRWLLKEEFYTRIIVPFWVLPVSSRQRLLEELGRFIEACAHPPLRTDEKMRLFLRRILFIVADILGIICLLVSCFFMAGEWLYQNGNIY